MTATSAMQRQIRAQLHAKLKAARAEYESTLERYAFEKYWRALNSFASFVLYGDSPEGHIQNERNTDIQRWPDR